MEGAVVFFGIAAHLMRNVLVDYARAHHTAKRGGGAVAITLEDTVALTPDSHVPDNLDVDAALNRLAQIDERKAKIIESRYFGGMTHEEIASAAGLTLTTVKRDLRLSEAWLRNQLTRKT